MTDTNILVIGGAGYIGSHMVKALLDAGHRVTVLDDLSKGHRELVPGGRFELGELGDRARLDALFGATSFDAVMHFAAYSLVGESVTDPLEYWRNNVAGTAVLLQAMRDHEVHRFIFSSTAAVYGEPVSVPIREDHPCSPTNPYGKTKLAVERMLADCDIAHQLRYISLRYFNAAGADPGGALGERHEPETHLIPLVLQVAAGQRDRVNIYGTDYPTQDGTCLRDYVHVNDLCQAHLLSLEKLLQGGASDTYNLGNSQGHSVRQVIDLARRITGHAIPADASPRRPGDPAVLVADSTRIRRDLGWRPVFEDLETIIGTAWQWHRREASR
jgi:UDP-glucose 4-epimerase